MLKGKFVAKEGKDKGEEEGRRGLEKIECLSFMGATDKGKTMTKY